MIAIKENFDRHDTTTPLSCKYSYEIQCKFDKCPICLRHIFYRRDKIDFEKILIFFDSWDFLVYELKPENYEHVKEHAIAFERQVMCENILYV